MTLLEYIPAPVMAGSGERIAGWGDLGVAAARLNGLADYDVPFGVPVDRAAAEVAARAAGTPFDGGVRSLLGRVENVMDLDEEGLIHGEINERTQGGERTGRWRCSTGTRRALGL